MTTNQTIDGVPRELLEACDRANSPPPEWARKQLRALLDAPACKACNGTRLVSDGVLHCSAGGIPFENGPIDCVKDCPDCTPAAQNQSEPATMNRGQFEAWVLGREHPTYGWLDKHWLARGDNPETYADPYVQGLWVASQSLYAEQPAPVATRPAHANPPQGIEPCGTHHDNDGLDEWRSTK